MSERSDEAETCQAETGQAKPGQAGTGEADVVTPDPGSAQEAAAQRYSFRRAPRYYPFGLTGLVLGVVAGLVIGYLPSDPVLDGQTYTTGSVLGYFVVGFGLIGVLLGLGLALLLERRRR